MIKLTGKFIEERKIKDIKENELNLLTFLVDDRPMNFLTDNKQYIDNFAITGKFSQDSVWDLVFSEVIVDSLGLVSLEFKHASVTKISKTPIEPDKKSFAEHSNASEVKATDIKDTEDDSIQNDSVNLQEEPELKTTTSVDDVVNQYMKGTLNEETADDIELTTEIPESPIDPKGLSFDFRMNKNSSVEEPKEEALGSKDEISQKTDEKEEQETELNPDNVAQEEPESNKPELGF